MTPGTKVRHVDPRIGFAGVGTVMEVWHDAYGSALARVYCDRVTETWYVSNLVRA